MRGTAEIYTQTTLQPGKLELIGPWLEQQDWFDGDAAAIERCRAHGHGTWHPWVGAVDAEAVAAAHVAGLRVNVWTCNDAEQAHRLMAWGVDGIVTDVPDLMVSARALATPGRSATPPRRQRSWPR